MQINQIDDGGLILYRCIWKYRFKTKNHHYNTSMEFDRQKGVFITFKYTPFIFCHKMLLSYPQTSTSFTFQMKYYEFPSRASFDCKSRLHMIIDFIMRGNGVLLCKIQTHCNKCIYSQQNVLCKFNIEIYFGYVEIGNCKLSMLRRLG